MDTSGFTPEPFDLAKYRSISVLGRKTQRINKRDAALAKDMASYKRLRADGLQPATVEGSARMERDATLPIELEMGKIFPKKDHPHVREGERISQEIGLRSPFDR